MRRSPRITSATCPPAHGAAPPAPRRGSTIVVVIALLLALTFLGLVGYTVGVQELSNATYFADAAREYEHGLSRDTLFDWSLRQIILGTRLEERQSALHGGHMSLLATMYGFNSTPYDGEGVNLAIDSSGQIVVDQGHTGGPSGDPAWLEINRAPFAQGIAGANVGAVDQADYPAPDVNHTYWDNNNPFIAYVNPNHVRNASGNRVQIALPSYHRPQYLRSTGIAPDTPTDNWYTDLDTQRRVLRPHKEDRAVDANGNVTATRRFVSNVHPDTRPVPVAERLNSFPFSVNDGVWSGGFVNHANVSYDADPDGDGFNEAIYMDLGYPMQIRENADGTEWRFVPMFAITIYDADALFNLNAHGNLAGLTAFTNAFGRFGPNGPGPNGDYSTNDLRFASQSNQGVGVSGVNPQWGLTAFPGDGSTEQHNRFFGRDPATNIELANMEWWFLLSGRADLDASSNIDKLYPGRYGEIDQLDTAMSNGLDIHGYPKAGSTFPAYPSPANFVPPNATDDNLDARLGGRYNGVEPYFPAAMVFPAWQQPLDLHGSGRFINPLPNTSNLFGRERFTQGAGQHKWPAYLGYQHNPDIDLWANVNTRFLMPSGSRRFNVDEPEETLLEPQYVRSDLDSVFGPAENTTLHLPEPDQDRLGLSGRVRDLAPMNFGRTDAAAEDRRGRYATNTWDLKSTGKTQYLSGVAPTAARPAEYQATFPAPTAINAFRSPVRELLGADSTSLVNYNFRKLSINHICEWEGAALNSNLIFRPLTPHPDANSPFGPLGPEPVNNVRTPGLTRPSQIASAADQEWFARRDRQRLCRDIYTLMYFYCGGADVDYTQAGVYPLDFDSNGDGAFDTNAQLYQMAQFAVNLVDRMDPDNISTKFEYQTDLSGGWQLDDDPYTIDPVTIGQRAEVFGVEEQGLALNEAQIIWAKRVLDNMDMPKNHDATEWDDTLNRDFTYIELENVSRGNINFATEAWQIAVKPPLTVPTTGGGTVTGEERRLTFTAAHPGISWGGTSIYLVGTAGDDQNLGTPPGTEVMPSAFRVNRNHNHPEEDMNHPNFDTQPHTDTAIPYPKISPRANIHLDLITGPQNAFRIHEGAAGTQAGDGPLIGGPAKGGELFHLNLTGQDDITEDDDRIINIEIELRRRANPLRSPVTPRTAGNEIQHEAESRDNPWIVVDRITVPMDVFTLLDTDNYGEIRTQLNRMRTLERRDPLVRQNDNLPAGQTPREFTPVVSAPATGRWVLNSLGVPNILGNINHLPPGPYEPYQHYQPHFNRDYASAMELMAVPLYGPGDTTRNLAQSNLAFDPANPQFVVAADKFKHPAPFNAGQPETGNRWYRLFEFVEVPDRSHRHPEVDGAGNPVRPSYVINLGHRISNQDPFYRQPGRIQLNTLRHPEVLGGLLDDPEVATLYLSDPTLHLPDSRELGFPPNPGNVQRDWWVQFVQARDGIDPVTGLFLPGLPSARPFRSFSYSADGPASLQSTLLRTLPMDNGQTTPRTLFELGNRNQQVDHSVKYRMLEKIINNSTTRSNVFLIFIQVDFFAAAEFDDPETNQQVVRVGGKLIDSPGYRGFFVVDRSKSKHLLSPQDFPQVFTDPVDPGAGNKFNFSFNQDFDFHQLILHRQTIN